MTEKETYLKDLIAYRKEVTSSKTRAQKFMKDAGIHDKKGNLNNSYKQQ